MIKIEQILDVKVSRYTPSKIIELSKTRPDIAGHIIAGYGITPGDTRSVGEIKHDM